MKMAVLPTDDDLRILADEGSFKRAQRYVTSDAIKITGRSEVQINSIVSGNEDYTVRLLLGAQLAASHCSCPAFAQGMFCKHLIATAIMARDGAKETQADAFTELHQTSPSTAQSLREFLESQPSSRLAEWLEDLANAEPAIERRLRLFQSRNSPTALRKALGGLLRVRRFLDWKASRKFAKELDLLPTLFAENSCNEQGLELYEYALARLFKIYEQSDDSGGDIGDQIRTFAEQYVERLKIPAPRAGKRWLQQCLRFSG